MTHFWAWAEASPFLATAVTLVALWGTHKFLSQVYTLLSQIVTLCHRRSCPGCGRAINGLPGPVLSMRVAVPAPAPAPEAEEPDEDETDEDETDEDETDEDETDEDDDTSEEEAEEEASKKQKSTLTLTRWDKMKKWED